MAESMSALVTKGGHLARETIPIPKPADNQALIKVSYVAQNPTDIQSVQYDYFGDGAVLGCDFTGVVEAIGSGVTRLKKGDLIAGLVWGGEIKGLGGYAQYTLADERICFPLPNGYAPEKAATVPLAACTAYLAFFSKDCLGINAGDDKKESVLIWGGSSSVGLYAIQIAAQAGLKVITTCSPRNHEDAKSLGAAHVFDYREADVVRKIREVEPNLKYVFDTIGDETSSKLASQAVSEQGEGGVLCTVRPDKEFTEEVTKHTRVTAVLVFTAFLKDLQYRTARFPKSQEDNDLAAAFFDKAAGWLSAGTLKPNNAKVYENGLDDVPKGFQEYRDGKISNYKVVYKL